MPILGLNLVHAYLPNADETSLLAAVDALPWMDALKRRVQHYGYRYDYKARKVDAQMYLGPLPDWAQSIANRLVSDGYMPKVADQLIVNEYEPGQGISAHVDCVPCFGSVVCSLTLGSSCVMELTAVEGEGMESIVLERGSLLVLAEDARYQWKHAIPGRKSDKIAGVTQMRSRRVSLTFRTVIVDMVIGAS